MTFRIALFIFILFSGAAHAASLNEASARQFVADMDTAVKAKDIAAIDRMLADHFTFKLVSRLFGVTDKVETDKNGFLGHTRDGLNMAEYYKSKRAFLNIAVEGDKAICTSELTESMVQRGAYISTVTSEKFVIELIDGALLYTSYEGSMRKK